MATVLNVPYARHQVREYPLLFALVILTLLAIANIPVHLPSDFQWPCSTVDVPHRSGAVNHGTTSPRCVQHVIQNLNSDTGFAGELGFAGDGFAAGGSAGCWVGLASLQLLESFNELLQSGKHLCHCCGVILGQFE